MIGAGVGHRRSGTIVIYDRHDALAEIPEEFNVVDGEIASIIGCFIPVESDSYRASEILKLGEGTKIDRQTELRVGIRKIESPQK